MNPLRRSLLGMGVALLALAPLGLPPASAGESDTQGLSVRQIDLQLGHGVASIATRPDAPGFVIGFANCQVVVVDGSGSPSDRYDIAGCKTLFTVRLGKLERDEAIVASTYTGQTAVISGGRVTQHKVHKAAVTDGYLVGRRLITSSDDGSVRLLPLGGAGGRVLTTAAGVARVLLVDPAVGGDVPAFFAGYDTGHIRAVAADGKAARTYESEVGRINALGLASDRGSLLVAGFDGRLRAVDLSSGRATDLLAAGGGINAMALDRNRARVGVVSDDGSFILLDLVARAELARAKLADGALTALAFDEMGSTALAGDSAGLLHLIALPGGRATQASGPE
jgi:hypothetical protein